MACCSLTQSANALLPRDATLVSRATISSQVPNESRRINVDIE